MPLPNTRRNAAPGQRGLTLIELMTVVAVLAVVLAVAAPGLSAFGEGQSVKGLATDLSSDLTLARSEALKRNAPVVVQRKGNDWLAGWTVRAAGVALSDREPSRGRSTQITGAPDAITFNAYGRVSAPGNAVRMTVATPAATEATRCVELDLSGRARVKAGAC